MTPDRPTPPRLKNDYRTQTQRLAIRWFQGTGWNFVHGVVIAPKGGVQPGDDFAGLGEQGFDGGRAFHALLIVAVLGGIAGGQGVPVRPQVFQEVRREFVGDELGSQARLGGLWE